MPNTFECGNNQTLMAMVAAGGGLDHHHSFGVTRAHRFQSKLQMHPFPRKNFGRTLSLITCSDCTGFVIDLVNHKVLSELNRQVIADIHRAIPWLEDQFTLIA